MWYISKLDDFTSTTLLSHPFTKLIHFYLVPSAFSLNIKFEPSLLRFSGYSYQCERLAQKAKITHLCYWYAGPLGTCKFLVIRCFLAKNSMTQLFNLAVIKGGFKSNFNSQHPRAIFRGKLNFPPARKNVKQRHSKGIIEGPRGERESNPLVILPHDVTVKV